MAGRSISGGGGGGDRSSTPPRRANMLSTGPNVSPGGRRKSGVSKEVRDIQKRNTTKRKVEAAAKEAANSAAASKKTTKGRKKQVKASPKVAEKAVDSKLRNADKNKRNADATPAEKATKATREGEEREQNAKHGRRKATTAVPKPKPTRKSSSSDDSTTELDISDQARNHHTSIAKLAGEMVNASVFDDVWRTLNLAMEGLEDIVEEQDALPRKRPNVDSEADAAEEPPAKRRRSPRLS